MGFTTILQFSTAIFAIVISWIIYTRYQDYRNWKAEIEKRSNFIQSTRVTFATLSAGISGMIEESTKKSSKANLKIMIDVKKKSEDLINKLFEHQFGEDEIKIFYTSLHLVKSISSF